MSLQTEIDQAGADLIKELKDKKIPLPPDAEVETTVEEEPEVEVEAEQEVEEEDETALPEIADLTDDEQAEAQKFYRLMKDPATRILLVKEMAENAGLLKDISPASKPKEIAAAKKSIQETLEEELGPTMKFMVPGLSKARDKILAQEREESQTAISELSQQQVLSETSKVLDKLARETNGASRKFENQMASYIEKYPMANGQDVESYLREMLTLASKGQAKAITTKQINNKIRTAANNVSDRLPRTSSSVGSDALPTGKMSLDESVRWAARSLQQQGQKPVAKRK
jgi:uncharacterized protein YukE